MKLKFKKSKSIASVDCEYGRSTIQVKFKGNKVPYEYVKITKDQELEIISLSTRKAGSIGEYLNAEILNNDRHKKR